MNHNFSDKEDGMHPRQMQQGACPGETALSGDGLDDNTMVAYEAARGFGSFGIPGPKKLKR